MKIRTPGSPTNVKINVQCFDKEEMGSIGLLGESQKVFSWSYEDLRGFDLGVVQYIIKLVGKK